MLNAAGWTPVGRSPGGGSPPLYDGGQWVSRQKKTKKKHQRLQDVQLTIVNGLARRALLIVPLASG